MNKTSMGFSSISPSPPLKHHDSTEDSPEHRSLFTSSYPTKPPKDLNRTLDS